MLHVMGEARNELTRVDEEDPTSTLAPRCRKGSYAGIWVTTFD
jgi:hypothetical protein